MIADLKPYPATKDSGVEWLGEVPEHWELQQLGHIGRFSKGNGGTKADEVPEGIPCIRYGDIYMHHKFFIRRSRSCVSSERVTDYTPIHFGDMLFAGSGETIEEIGKSAVNLIESQACCGGDVILFRPAIALDPRFMGYAADCPQAAFQKALMGRGITVMHVYGDQLKYMWIALPPLPEQAAIVRFINYVDQRIRRYIRAKQKLIKLLEEQKQAIIHRAVTGQINVRTGRPYPAYKPSGLEWLGDVPEHWEVLRARYLFREIDIRSRTGEETHLSMSQKLGLVPNTMVEQRTLVSESYAGAKLCETGDLVLNRLKAHLGVFALAKQRGVISPDYTVFRPICPMTIEYFEHVLRSPACRRELRIRAKGIVEGLWRLYTDDFYDIRLPVPPASEQQSIVDGLRRLTRSVDEATGQTRREIDLIHEYRTRLIADVVTGKLDVREAAASLPDESDDLVEEDELDDTLADETRREIDEEVVAADDDA